MLCCAALGCYDLGCPVLRCASLPILCIHTAASCIHPVTLNVLCCAVLCCAVLAMSVPCVMLLTQVLPCCCRRRLLNIRQGLICAKPSSQSALLEGAASSSCHICRPLSCFMHRSRTVFTDSASGKSSLTLTSAFSHC